MNVKCPKFLFVYMLSLMYPAARIQAQDTPTKAKDQLCIELIQEARSIISTDPTRASELLEKAIDECSRAKAIDVRDQEALRWQIALINLKRAESTQNKCQKYELGDLAVQYWLEYISWYEALPSDLRDTLKPRYDRIQSAIRFLGNSIIARGSPSGCPGKTEGIKDLFSIYMEIPVVYISSRTVKFWKEWLWKCPSWVEGASKSYSELRKKFCEGTLECAEEWLTYNDFLKTWLDTKGSWLEKGRPRDRNIDLSKATINSTKRELERLKNALSCEKQ